MNKQLTLSTIQDELAQSKTHKKEFLAQIERIVPWEEWISIIKLHYYEGERGLAHHVEVTSANVHDATMMPKLLTGCESTVHGDSGYIGAEKRKDAIVRNKKGKKINYRINRRPSQSKNKSSQSRGQIRCREREKSSVRAKVEHVFGAVKGLFGYRKTRYRGLRKQTAKLNMLFALANLVLADRRCLDGRGKALPVGIGLFAYLLLQISITSCVLNFVRQVSRLDSSFVFLGRLANLLLFYDEDIFYAKLRLFGTTCTAGGQTEYKP